MVSARQLLDSDRALLRDRFAEAALREILADALTSKPKGSREEMASLCEQCAQTTYLMVDAMLRERSKNGP